MEQVSLPKAGSSDGADKLPSLTLGSVPAFSGENPCGTMRNPSQDAV